MKKLFIKLTSLVAALVLTATLAAAGQAKEGVSGRQRVMEKIRKELVTLPFYGVFDNLAYQIEGGTVTLYGQVVRPSTRSDAARTSTPKRRGPSSAATRTRPTGSWPRR